MKKTIDSIKKQTFTNYEVWIIDGNSAKETQEFLSKLPAPFFYQSKKDKGIYDAMNKGVSLSKGEWLYFLGAGDFFKEDSTLTTISTYFEMSVDVILGNIEYDVSTFDTIPQKKKTKLFNSKLSSLLWIKNTLHHQSLFYNRNIFTNFTYNTQYKVLADYDLNLKLFKVKPLTVKVNETIAICDVDGVSKNYNWSMYKEEIILKTKNSSIFCLPFFFLLGFIKFLIRKK